MKFKVPKNAERLSIDTIRANPGVYANKRFMPVHLPQYAYTTAAGDKAYSHDPTIYLIDDLYLVCDFKFAHSCRSIIESYWTDLYERERIK